MARVIGVVSRNTNYEVTVKKPLDARSLVKTYEDLLLESNWLNDAGKSIAYNGMLVAVANTSDISKNGLYFLFDINCTSSLKSPDVTLESNWLKIGETSEIGDFADRLSKIDSELEDIKDRLEALENDSDVITYGYRSGFPIEGESNKLYVAADEAKTYVWVNGNYLAVSSSGSDYEEPEVINGGSAD
jgi:hypothetical protein